MIDYSDDSICSITRKHEALCPLLPLGNNEDNNHLPCSSPPLLFSFQPLHPVYLSYSLLLPRVFDPMHLFPRFLGLALLPTIYLLVKYKPTPTALYYYLRHGLNEMPQPKLPAGGPRGCLIPFCTTCRITSLTIIQEDPYSA